MLLESLCEDFRLASHGLLRARGFTTATVLTLAVGIGATATMFAVVEGVLLRPLPVREQDRLLVAWQALPGGAAHWPFRAADILEVGKESRAFEAVAGVSYYDREPVRVVDSSGPAQVTAASVTGDFFRVIGAGPLLGRTLRASDDVVGAENVLVITSRLWQSRFGGAGDVLGRRLLVGEQPFTIVGVMPRDVECPHGVEVWMTLSASASTVAFPAFREGVLRDVDLVARLRPGATIEQARGEIQQLVSRLEAEGTADQVRGATPVVQSYEDVVVGNVRPSLLVLFGAVGLVLLIASANGATLLLLRGEARRGELAVRAALGATPGRLARQMLAESLLLSLAAGIVGLGVTRATIHSLLAVIPEGLARIESVRVDGVVLLFTFAVVSLTAGLAGLAPVLSLAGVDLVPHLRAGGRGATESATRRGRRALVVAQVAIAVTVVAAAGLLTRSLLRLEAADTGLSADLALVRLGVPQAKYADGARHLQLMREVVAQLEAAPGIAGATPVHTPPFAGTGWDAPDFTAEGQSIDRTATNPSLSLESIHPSYFAALEVIVARGRGFTEADGPDAPKVVVVSNDLATRTWPAENPIGKRMKLGPLGSAEPWRMVVGVAGPTRYRDLRTPKPTIYLPAAQFIDTPEMLILRSRSPLSVVASLTRDRVRSIDPQVQVLSVTSYRDLRQGPLARPRFNALLIGLFALAALLLAAVGLYCVVSASVRQRLVEMGVRKALGASGADLRRLVLGEALRLASLGVVLGLTGTLAVTHLLQGLLYGVHPLDPLTLLAATLLLVGVAAVAATLPAHRASRVDPMALLRGD